MWEKENIIGDTPQTPAMEKSILPNMRCCLRRFSLNHIFLFDRTLFEEYDLKLFGE